MSAGLPEGGRFGRFEVRLAERRLHVDGEPVALGSRAFDLLAALVERRDRVVPKDELIEVVWPGLIVEDNNLQVQISALRKVLGVAAIATVPGRGYRFTVAVSAAEPAAAGGAASPRPAADARAGLPAALTGAAGPKSRLLVADDNKVNRLLLCRSLELMGHDVASADNGRSALERLRGEHFDLLLLDLEMPELDGFGVLAQRAADPALGEVPVIVTSSLEGAAQVARCIELGADDFLHKPVNPMLLKARVESSLERKHLRDRERALLARLAPGAGPADESTAPRFGEATLLVARLRGLEALANEPPQDTLELVSSWATLMVDAIEGRGGRAGALTGDALMASFGADAPWAGEGGAAAVAAQAALEMIELVGLFNAERAAAAKATIGLAVGIASGMVVAGRAGPTQRAGFVCIGAPVQRAAALEAAAGGPGETVLIDDATRVAVAGRVASRAGRPMTLPGSAAPVAVHVLTPA